MARIAKTTTAKRESRPHEKQTVRGLLEGMILKHEARRWDAARTAAAEAKPPAAKRHTRSGDR